MTLINLDRIRENGHNVRRTPATVEQDEQLEHSIRALGVLQPVLLRLQDAPDGFPSDGYLIVAGHRRVRCARAAGLEEIPAEVLPRLSNGMYAAMQVAENVIRVPMDPVDQWRAVVSLQASGYTLKQAADALGISERKARQLDKMGHIIPEILDLLVGQPKLDMDDIAAIASAPSERQAQAFSQTDEDGDFDWRLSELAERCSNKRLPRSLAIFDIETAEVLFEEDLFAQPSSDEQFMTTDIPGFIKAQKAALEARVAARSKKERIQIGKADKYSGSIELPKSFSREYGPQKKSYPKKGAAVLFTAVAEDGYYIGQILEMVGTDRSVAQKAAAGSKPFGEEDADGSAEIDEGDGNIVDDEGEVDTGPAPEPDFADALSKAGKTLLAEKKTTALRERLASAATSSHPLQLGVLCAGLIVALAGDNVSVNGNASRYGQLAQFSDLAQQIVGPGGEFAVLTDDQLADLAAQALARMLRIADPVTGAGSGHPAEWIGAAIGADTALPRFDTAEFLACMSKAALTELAADNGRTGLKTAGGIREALVGNLPDWRPTSFGAPGLRLVTAAATDIEDETEEAA